MGYYNEPPAKYILRGKPPYHARSASNKTNDWPFWYVTDNATEIAEKSNKELTQ